MLPHNGLVSKATIPNLTLQGFILQNLYPDSYIAGSWWKCLWIYK